MSGEKIDYSKMDFGADGEATVLAVPGNRPWVLNEEESKEFLKNFPTRTAPPTREEREEVKKRADRWRKPEKRQYGQ